MLSSKRFVQCHLDTSRRSSIFPCSCVWMTAITFLKARLYDTQIRSRTFSDSQLNKFFLFSNMSHRHTSKYHAGYSTPSPEGRNHRKMHGIRRKQLLLLSNCSFSSFEGSESKASVTTMAPIGSVASIYRKNFPETCACYTLPPKQDSCM